MVASLSSSFGPSRLSPLLRPRLTSRSAFPRCPFRREARSPQVRTLSFTVRPPDLRRLSLGHRSFAVACPFAPLGTASDPVLVHRPTVSLPASFPRSVALTQLRFASIRMTSFRRDLHLQDSAHAGRTKRKGRAGYRLGLLLFVRHIPEGGPRLRGGSGAPDDSADGGT